MKDIIEQVQSTNPCIGTVMVFKGDTFKYWDEGCTRYVFVNEGKTQVIKLPKGKYDGLYNDLEDKIYKESSEEDRDNMALTRLEDGIIIQEFCMPAKWAGIKLSPSQLEFSRSCRKEVGWNQAGELVCFDLDEYLKY